MGLSLFVTSLSVFAFFLLVRLRVPSVTLRRSEIELIYREHYLVFYAELFYSDLFSPYVSLLLSTGSFVKLTFCFNTGLSMYYCKYCCRFVYC